MMRQRRTVPLRYQASTRNNGGFFNANHSLRQANVNIDHLRTNYVSGRVNSNSNRSRSFQSDSSSISTGRTEQKTYRDFQAQSQRFNSQSDYSHHGSSTLSSSWISESRLRTPSYRQSNTTPATFRSHHKSTHRVRSQSTRSMNVSRQSSLGSHFSSQRQKVTSSLEEKAQSINQKNRSFRFAHSNQKEFRSHDHVLNNVRNRSIRSTNVSQRSSLGPVSSQRQSSKASKRLKRTLSHHKQGVFRQFNTAPSTFRSRTKAINRVKAHPQKAKEIKRRFKKNLSLLKDSYTVTSAVAKAENVDEAAANASKALTKIAFDRSTHLAGSLGKKAIQKTSQARQKRRLRRKRYQNKSVHLATSSRTLKANAKELKKASNAVHQKLSMKKKLRLKSKLKAIEKRHLYSRRFHSAMTIGSRAVALGAESYNLASEMVEAQDVEESAKALLKQSGKSLSQLAFKRRKGQSAKGRLRKKSLTRQKMKAKKKLSALEKSKKANKAFTKQALKKKYSKGLRDSLLSRNKHKELIASLKSGFSKTLNFFVNAFQNMVLNKKLLLIGIGLMLLALFSTFTLFSGGVVAQVSNSAYVITGNDATAIDMMFTKKEMEYFKSIMDKADQAEASDDSATIEYDPVGHDPHKVLALFNVLFLPRYADKIKDNHSLSEDPTAMKEIEDLIDELIKYRYKFTEESETTEYEDDKGHKHQSTHLVLRSVTTSFDNITAPDTFNGEAPKNAKEFIEKLGPIMAKVAAKNDLYASVMLAQAGLESYWGQSKVSRSPYFNLFGIKGAYKGQSVNMRTQEDDGSGNLYGISAGWRDYPSYQESIEDYAYVLKHTGGIYRRTWKSNSSSYTDATRALQGTYATDTSYASKLNKIIKQFNLTRFDHEDYAQKAIDQDEKEQKQEAEDKAEAIKDAKNVKEIKKVFGGDLFHMTEYEQKLYQDQYKTKGFLGIFPSPLGKKVDWGDKNSSYFSFVYNYDKKAIEVKNEIGIKAPNKKVYAQQFGTVQSITKQKDGSYTVTTDSKGEMSITYKNLKKVTVQVDDEVDKNKEIGSTGKKDLEISMLATEEKSIAERFWNAINLDFSEAFKKISPSTLNPVIMMYTKKYSEILYGRYGLEYSEGSELGSGGGVKGDVVKTAKGMLGWFYYIQAHPSADLGSLEHPNRKGGTDCSGFVWLALHLAGYKVPPRMGWFTGSMEADAKGAHHYLKAINPKSAKAGDVVIVNVGGGAGNLGHTAILLEPWHGNDTKIIQQGGSSGKVNEGIFGYSFSSLIRRGASITLAEPIK